MKQKAIIFLVNSNFRAAFKNYIIVYFETTDR